MKSRMLIVGVIAAFTLSSLVFVTASSSAENTYLYFFLVMQWPATYCKSVTYYPCLRPQEDRFTVHGLWPQNNTDWSQPQPEGCDPQHHPFDLKELIHLATLNYYWPNFNHPRVNSTFWEKEWEKHGTCSLPQHSLRDYFEIVASLVQQPQLNVSAILKTNSIVPDPAKKYEVGKIAQALAGNEGLYVLVECRSRKLFQAYFKVDKDGKKLMTGPAEFRRCRSGDLITIPVPN